MITILVTSRNQGFLQNTEEQLRDDSRHIACHASLTEAEALLQEGSCDLCILDIAEWNDDLLDRVAEFKRRFIQCEFIAVADGLPPDGADRLHRTGVDRVVPRRLRGSMLENIIARRRPLSRMMTVDRPDEGAPLLPGKRVGVPDLDILRDISRILSHSLDLRGLVLHFTLKVREIVGVNRIAIFLEEPRSATPASVNRPSHRLSCVCAVGVPHDVQNCVELTKRGGIGRWVTQSGRILRAENAASLQSGAEISRVQHEFDLLDCQVAIPINDRERTIGVALLGGHLTRASFNDDELQLMFHLMEELGLSVKNSWLHSELTANNRLFSDVLSSLRSGNLVVGPDLEVLHVNPAMARLLRVNEDPDRPIVFADLPPPIAAKVHEVVENGKLADPFELDLSDGGGPYLRVSIIPLQNGEKNALPQSAMVVVEDFTEVEKAKKLAVESANLQLTSLIAKRFAHEIRNSLVPLTTHLQLLDEQYGEPDFQTSLRTSLARETGRITHFTEQMLYLAEPKFPPTSVVSIEKLLREAFARAQQLTPSDSSLSIRGPSEACSVTCHPQALRHALLEIFANSLQSAPSPVEVVVQISLTGDDGTQRVSLAFRDSGPGFTPETARRATEAFYTTRTTGAGLGLTVARKVVTGLGGELEIRPRLKDSPADLILSLPLTPSHA